MATRQELQTKYQENQQKHNIDSAERKLAAMRLELQKRDIDTKLKTLEDEQLKADIAKMEFEKQLSEEIAKLPPVEPPKPATPATTEEKK